MPACSMIRGRSPVVLVAAVMTTTTMTTATPNFHSTSCQLWLLTTSIDSMHERPRLLPETEAADVIPPARRQTTQTVIQSRSRAARKF